MKTNIFEINYDVKKAIDLAFNNKFVLKFYDYLKIKETKKDEIDDFIQSYTANEISNIILDLNEYIKGGSDEIHVQLREGYGYISKNKAKKIKEYLSDILNDAMKYSNDKRKGRKKRSSK